MFRASAGGAFRALFRALYRGVPRLFRGTAPAHVQVPRLHPQCAAMGARSTGTCIYTFTPHIHMAHHAPAAAARNMQHAAH
jgi:hypothetical protein